MDRTQEEIENFADDVMVVGEILEPLVVRRIAGTDTFEILAGHKRYNACKYLCEVKNEKGFELLPCVEKNYSDVMAAYVVYDSNNTRNKSDYEIMTMVENMARLIKEHPEDFNLDKVKGRFVEKLAAILGMSKSTTQINLTLANNLSNKAKEAYKKEEFAKETAKVLASLPKEQQDEMIDAGITTADSLKYKIKEQAPHQQEDGKEEQLPGQKHIDEYPEFQPEQKAQATKEKAEKLPPLTMCPLCNNLYRLGKVVSFEGTSMMLCADCSDSDLSNLDIKNKLTDLVYSYIKNKQNKIKNK